MAKQWQTSSTIEITGGSDVTNPELIAWLGANAVQQEGPERNYELKPVSCYIKATGSSTSTLRPVRYFMKQQGWVDASDKNITDLSGTKWYFKGDGEITANSNLNCYLDCTVNNIDCSMIMVSVTLFTTDEVAISYATSAEIPVLINAYYNTPGGSYIWADQAYRTIEITGGTDSTNATLIAWLKQNALLWNSSLQPVVLLQKVEEEITEEPTLISFMIVNGQGTTMTFQAEEGMTWEEWINSEYNTGNANLFEYNGTTLVRLGEFPISNVTPTGIINADTIYIASGGSND